MGRPSSYKIISKIRQDELAEYLKGQMTAQSPEEFSKTVFIKKYLAQFVTSREIINSLASDIKIYSALNHPNILQIFDFYTNDGKVSVAQEFVNGLTLREAIDLSKKTNKPFAWQTCLYIAIEVLKGVAYAHRLKGSYGPLNIIHCDISPENILLSFSGQVKLTNFDNYKLKKIRSKNTDFQPFKTKLLYTSPELIRNKEPTPAADIFSVGTILYELISLRHPFLDLEVTQLLEIMESEERETLETLVPTLKPEISVAVEKALQANPENRYKNASDFVDALIELQETKWVSRGQNLLEEVLGELSPKEQQEREEVERTYDYHKYQSLPSEPLGLVKPNLKPKKIEQAPQKNPEPPQSKKKVILISSAGAAVLLIAIVLLIRTNKPDSTPSPVFQPQASVEKKNDGELENRKGIKTSSAQVGKLEIIGPDGTQVTINGRNMGVLPLDPITLPARPYTVVLKNEDDEKMKMVNIENQQLVSISW